MKTIAHLRLLLFAMFLFFTNSCKKRVEPPPQSQGIFVTVTDRKTNRSIKNAEVQVNISGSPQFRVTDDAGKADFPSLETDTYQVRVTKSGYVTKTQNVTVSSGSPFQPTPFLLDPVLEFIPAQLDFAAQERIKKFDIINNSDKDVGFSIKVNNNWISVEPTSGTIPKDGRRVPITVTVDDKGRIPAKYEGTLTLDFGGAVPSENYLISMIVPNLDAPSVSCDQPVGITRTSAEVLGTIMSVGKTPITNHGHVWSETQSPEWGVPGTYTDFKARGTGQFTSTIGTLKPGTIYYVRAYARNENGINYSKEEHKITTSNTFTAPGVRIGEVSNITPTSVRVTGKITNNGGADVVEYGHVISKTDPTPDPDAPGAVKTTFKGEPANGDFTSNFTGLDPNSKYYVVAYAKNGSVSTPGRSPVVTFNTPEPITEAKVSTSAATNVEYTTTTFNGSVTEYGSLQIIDHGFVFSRSNADPKLNVKGCDSKSLGNLPKSQPSFSTIIFGLSKGTSYFYRAYVKPEGGQPIYGSAVRIFVTKEDYLIYYWTFNNDFSDVTGNGNHADGSSKRVADRFNNIDKAMDLSFGAIYEAQTNRTYIAEDLTVSLWVKLSESNFSGNKKTIYGHSDGMCLTSPYWTGFFLYFDPSRPEGSSNILFYIGDSRGGFTNTVRGVFTKEDVSFNSWQQIVIVKSGSKWKFFLDGNLQLTDTFNTNFEGLGENGSKSYMGPPWAGCNESFSNLNGQVDDVRRYNKAFSDADVKELYNREKP